MKEPRNQVNKNAIAVVPNNSHCKEEMVAHVQWNMSMIVSMFLFLPYCAWVSLQLGNASTIEVIKDWKSL